MSTPACLAATAGEVCYSIYMKKLPDRSPVTGRFVVGRVTSEKISAVEGLRRTERANRLISLSDSLRESPAQLRDRVRAEFRKK